jgi:hypothetical protein
VQYNAPGDRGNHLFLLIIFYFLDFHPGPNFGWLPGESHGRDLINRLIHSTVRRKILACKAVGRHFESPAELGAADRCRPSWR